MIPVLLQLQWREGKSLSPGIAAGGRGVTIEESTVGALHHSGTARFSRQSRLYKCRGSRRPPEGLHTCRYVVYGEAFRIYRPLLSCSPIYAAHAARRPVQRISMLVTQIPTGALPFFSGGNLNDGAVSIRKKDGMPRSIVPLNVDGVAQLQTGGAAHAGNVA